jgi:phosphate transport system substrate-binding protein
MVGIKSSVRVACALATMLLFHNQVVAGQSLRVGGTGATNEMVKSLGPLLLAETGIKLEVIPGLGTVGGNKAVADGVIDLSISGRVLKPAETARGLIAVAEFRTPFGLVTSHPNPNGFKSSEIAPLYQSDAPVWADGTPILIILRPSVESDNSVLSQMFPGMSAAMAKARDRSDVPVAATDQDNTEMAEGTPGSLIAATFTQISMEKRKLWFVAIDGVAPSVENYEKGTYPYGKSLYFVLAAQKSPAGERFLAFLRSPMGAASLRDAGVLLIAR